MDSSQRLSGNDLIQVKQYLKAILPKYNSNSKITLINSGNDTVEVILSPHDKFQEAATIRQQVNDMRLLQGKQSMRKAFEYVLSSLYSSNNDKHPRVKIVVLTTGITDTDMLPNSLVTLSKKQNAVFTYVVFGDSYGTEKYLRPKLGTDDVIVEIPDLKLLPQFLDEIHGSVVNGIAGM